jgi:hypothetical protein
MEKNFVIHERAEFFTPEELCKTSPAIVGNREGWKNRLGIIIKATGQPNSEKEKGIMLQIDSHFLIAFTFIVGFFIMLGIGFVIFLQTNKMETLNFVGTLFGGWVGTIIGYYFGQRPAERERRRVEELTEYLKKRSDEMWARLEKMGGKEK